MLVQQMLCIQTPLSNYKRMVKESRADCLLYHKLVVCPLSDLCSLLLYSYPHCSLPPNSQPCCFSPSFAPPVCVAVQHNKASWKAPIQLSRNKQNQMRGLGLQDLLNLLWCCLWMKTCLQLSLFLNRASAFLWSAKGSCSSPCSTTLVQAISCLFKEVKSSKPVRVEKVFICFSFWLGLQTVLLKPRRKVCALKSSSAPSPPAY